MCYVNCEVMALRLKKAAAAAAAVLLFLMANLRFEYTVSAGGEELPGRWTRAEINSAVRAATAAAEEVARGESAPPELELRAEPVFAASGSGGSASALSCELLGRCEGVEAAYLVTVDGTALGVTADSSAFGEAMDALLSSLVSREAVSAHVAGEIALSPVCVPEGEAESATAMAEAVCAAAPVIYFTPDGRERIAVA